jgi:hypothetical protein
MSLSEVSFLIPGGILSALVSYEVEIFTGRAKTDGKAHPNRMGYRQYAESLYSEWKPLIGLSADDPLPKFQSGLTAADATSTQGANGWLTGSDASPGQAVLGVSVEDPSEVAAAAATINDNTSCPTNTAGAAECSVVDVSAQRKEWRFRFHEDGIYRLEFTAEGKDGQTASYAHDVSVDLHDPEAFAEPSRPPDTNGWYTAPVDVMLGGEDPGGGSGVQKTEYTLNGGPVQDLVPGEMVTVEDKGTTTLRYQSVDGAGRRSSMQAISINIDATPPVIEVPADIIEYTTGPDGAQVDYSATATDYVDGDVVVGDVPVDCSPVSGSTFPVGATQVNCSATDAAGNEATKTFHVSVLYDFCNGTGGGFAEPVTNGVLNEVKAGSGVPVKFGLGGNMGLDIFATGYPTSRKISCDTQAVTDSIEETVAVTNSGLKYDPTAGQYIYNLKTEKVWANTCRELVVKLKDGTEHPINFKFK